MGVSADAVNHDLMAVYGGGEPLAKRMADFTNAKEMAEKALADLALGRDAKVAHDDAVKQREESSRLLAEAQDKSDKMLADALASSRAMRDEAEAEVRNVREQTQAWVHATRDDLEHKHVEVTKRLADAENAASKVEKHLAELEGAKKAHEASAKKYHDFINQINNVIASHAN